MLETQVDPAAWEIAGHIVLKRQEDYDTVTQVCVLALSDDSAQHGLLKPGSSAVYSVLACCHAGRPI